MSTLVDHPVAPLEAVPIGEGRAFAVAGREIAVFRPRSGVVYATQARCPHAGGPLADGQLDDCVVLCPLHANTFDLASGASRTGAPPVEVFAARVEDGVVVVALPG